MSMEIRCNVCGARIDEEAERADEWWNVACWKRKATFSRVDGGKRPDNPDEAFGKDVCPNCMPGVLGQLSSAGRRP